MKLTPFQLAALVVGGFTSIILLNVLTKYQSNEDFRTQLQSMKPADLLKIRTRRIAEEAMEPASVATEQYEDNEDENDNG